MSVPLENAFKVYKIFRDYIEHEDDLINHRMIAMITIQSFILATFGLGYQKRFEIAEKLFSCIPEKTLTALGPIAEHYNGFLLVLAGVGVITSLIAWISIRAATTAIRTLENGWLRAQEKLLSIEGSMPEFFPQLTGGGNAKASRTGITLSLWAPAFLFIFWTVTMIVLTFEFYFQN